MAGGCGGYDNATETDASPAPPAGAPRGSRESETAVEGRFDVGPYKLFIRCKGTRSPTIVHLHGLGGTSDDAATVPDAVGGRQRFCVYDRASMGSSDAARGYHTGRDSVRDLHALLEAADIDGPYVLVGASFGGLLATMYAGTFPDDVVGLVLLDATLPTYTQVYGALPADQRQMLIDRSETNPEGVKFFASMREAQALVARVPDIPVTYLAASEPDIPPSWPIRKMRKLIREQQRAFVNAFPRGRLRVVDAPHFMEPVIPELIAEEVRRVLRSRAARPGAE